MGRSRTPRLVVEETWTHPMVGRPEWRVRAGAGRVGYGRPTTSNLAAYVAAGEASMREGGVNWHITQALRANGDLPEDGYPRVLSARIVRNNGSNDIVAEWTA